LGLSFQPTGDPAIASATGGQDFGQLFLGFSFFLILSALALVSLLFRLALINRADELGILLATGWPIRRLRGLILRETLVVALPGVVLGALAGILYGQGIIIALNTIWRGAVAGTGLEFHASVLDLAIGAVSSLAIVILTVWFLIRGAAKRPARELLNEGLRESLPTHLRPLQTWRRALPAVVSVLGLLMLAASFAVSESERPGLCFGAGFFLLIGLLWGFRQRMAKVPKSEGIPSFASLAARAPIRNPSRSMTTAGLLASAAFMVVAIGANKLDATRNATQRNSGTGGFALWAESALPVIQDLNITKGLDFYTLDHSKVGGMNVVPMKVREGDEASCLNLNRALRPRILGVNPQLLAQRHAFTLTDTLSGEPESRDWAKLLPPGKAGATVRGVVDANSLEWSLHKKVGDTIDYVDESGRPFQVLVVGAIANSILQGSVVIAESDFIQRFPNESGYRTFLIDAPAAQQQSIAAELTRGLSDLGFEALPTTTRLAAFNAVENTYLNTFQILGGLGLLLGSAGLGIVVMRNVAERRSEFGVLRALGFQLGAIRRMVLIEHAALLVIGLGIGAVSALIAVLPALLSPGPETDWLSLVITMVAILICGLACTWFGTRIAVTGQVTEALRGE
jgi:ABC-type antimicrobial peptide transport system permease subunit